MMKQLFTDKRLLSYPQRLKRLRYFTVIFFILLFIPISMVFYQGYIQYQQDQLRHYQNQTNKITSLVNKRLFKRTALANAIPINEFDYYQTLYNPISKEVSKALSPLSTEKHFELFKGHKGYFQLDHNGQFNSPVWPSVIKDGKSLLDTSDNLTAELSKRRAIAFKLYQVTSQSPELKSLIGKKSPSSYKKFRVLTDVPDYFIFYRAVSILDEIKIQGYIIHRDDYLVELLNEALNYAPIELPTLITVKPKSQKASSLYFISQKTAHGQTKITQQSEEVPELNQQLISQNQLNWPYKNYSVFYTTPELTLNDTAIYSISLMSTLLIAIAIGCCGFYYLGKKQLRLAEQRLNFVSSVSHELKTPLTSIRMYAEMLKSGMVLSEQHQIDYYEFIHSESERLSRLIDNILQLSSLSQPHHNVAAQYTKLSIVEDIIRSKASSLVEKNGFQLNICQPINNADNVLMFVDIDAFSQVVINIADNAVKFFDEDKIKDTNRKKIDFIFSQESENNNRIELEIRDYGVGISPEQEGKIFELFYRGGSELTRSTQGTGIGLALVNELVLAQQGEISVQRMNPGLAIKISFKSKGPSLYS